MLTKVLGILLLVCEKKVQEWYAQSLWQKRYSNLVTTAADAWSFLSPLFGIACCTDDIHGSKAYIRMEAVVDGDIIMESCHWLKSIFSFQHYGLGSFVSGVDVELHLMCGKLLTHFQSLHSSY